MGLETGTYISDLVATNPVNATDVVGEGDDHLRLIKSCLLNTLPSLTGAMTLTHTQLNNALVKTEQSELTGIATGSDYPIKLKSNAPMFGFEESDQAADEKVWDFGAAGSTFLLRSRTDAYGAGVTAMLISRTATAIDDIQFSSTLLSLRDGGAFRVYDSTNTDYAEWSHNGSAAKLTCVNTGDVIITGPTGRLELTSMQGLDIRDGGDLVIRDSTDADFGQFYHDGTDLFLASQGTGTFRITNLSNMYLQDGASFRIYDSSDVDYIGMQHDGTDGIHFYGGSNWVRFRNFNNGIIFEDGCELRLYDTANTDYLAVSHNGTDVKITGVNTTDIDVTGATYFNFQTGMRLRIWDAGNVDTLRLLHNGTDAVVEAEVGDLSLLAAGGNLNTNSLSLTTSNDSADEPGFKGAPHNEQNGNYTLVLTDAGKKIYKASGASNTITIPANSSVAFPVGTIIVIDNDSGNSVNVAITTDTLEEYNSGTTGTQALPDNNKAIIEKVTSTKWKYQATG